MATDGKRDRELLRSPCDVEDGVSIFGSARVKEGHRWYELCRETAACLSRNGFTVISAAAPA